MKKGKISTPEKFVFCKSQPSCECRESSYSLTTESSSLCQPQAQWNDEETTMTEALRELSAGREFYKKTDSESWFLVLLLRSVYGQWYEVHTCLLNQVIILAFPLVKVKFCTAGHFIYKRSRCKFIVTAAFGKANEFKEILKVWFLCKLGSTLPCWK